MPSKIDIVTFNLILTLTSSMAIKMIKCVDLMSISYRSIYVSILNHSFRGVKFTIFLYFCIVDCSHHGCQSGCYLGNQILLYFQQRNKFYLYYITVKIIISEYSIYSCKRNFFVVKWVIFFKIWPLTFNMTLTLTSSMLKTGDKICKSNDIKLREYLYYYY